MEHVSYLYLIKYLNIQILFIIMCYFFITISVTGEAVGEGEGESVGEGEGESVYEGVRVRV